MRPCWLNCGDVLRALEMIAVWFGGIKESRSQTRMRREALLNDRTVAHLHEVTQRVERACEGTERLIADVRRDERLKVALSVLERRALG